MEEKQCMCTAVFCGHAFGEKCPNQESVQLRMAVGTGTSGFGLQVDIGMCSFCWANLQRTLPGLFHSKLPVKGKG